MKIFLEWFMRAEIGQLHVVYIPDLIWLLTSLSASSARTLIWYITMHFAYKERRVKVERPGQAAAGGPESALSVTNSR